MDKPRNTEKTFWNEMDAISPTRAKDPLARCQRGQGLHLPRIGGSNLGDGGAS